MRRGSDWRGTRLRDVYGEEITGKRIDRVFAGACADYWHDIHARVAEEGSPSTAWSADRRQERDHIVLFWLRLPLSQDGMKVDRILCYDTAAAPIETARQGDEPELCILVRRLDRSRCGPRGAGRSAPEPQFRAAHQPKFSLVGRHQAKVAIELIAPMTRKGAPPLGAESPPELRQDQQTPFRALVRKLMRPKGRSGAAGRAPWR